MSSSHVTAIVFAKDPRPGEVKTRLMQSGSIDALQAADLALAMLRCLLTRLAGRMCTLLAVTPDGSGPAILQRLDMPGVSTIDQGVGDLGQRLDRVWQQMSDRHPIAFFGMDSPDVSAEALEAIERALEDADTAVGPTHDGGYWTLAANQYQPDLLRRVTWGSAQVYAETKRRAREANLRLAELPTWHDVDEIEDVAALRQRLQAFCQRHDLDAIDAEAFRDLAQAVDAILGVS